MANRCGSAEVARAFHNGLKSSDALWSTLECVGKQEVEACEDDPGYTLELRNCTICGSTLAKRVDPTNA